MQNDGNISSEGFDTPTEDVLETFSDEPPRKQVKVARKELLSCLYDASIAPRHVRGPHSDASGAGARQTLRILYLFSGKRKEESLAAEATAFGELIGVNVIVDEYDTENGEEGDLADDERWMVIESRLLSDYYDAMVESPPCSTFTDARTGGSGLEPQPLRTADGPGRYGRSDLIGQDKEEARLGTLLALRAAAAAKICLQVKVPWLLEQPWTEEHETAMLNLDEWREVLVELENEANPFGVRTRALQ